MMMGWLPDDIGGDNIILAHALDVRTGASVPKLATMMMRWLPDDNGGDNMILASSLDVRTRASVPKLAMMMRWLSDIWWWSDDGDDVIRWSLDVWTRARASEPMLPLMIQDDYQMIMVVTWRSFPMVWMSQSWQWLYKMMRRWLSYDDKMMIRLSWPTLWL